MMGYGTGDEGIAWTNSILAKYPDRYAILGVHSYMHETGVLTTLGKGIYQKIVVPNPNVRLVLCGHHHAAGRKDVYKRQRRNGLCSIQNPQPSGWGFLIPLRRSSSPPKVTPCLCCSFQACSGRLTITISFSRD